MSAEQSELGKKSVYDTHYDPTKLFPIPRQNNRQKINLDSANLPFYGFDYWNHYEVSWLNTKGKPIVAIAEITYSCDSVNIIESKSMKLYFNSFNNTKFENIAEVEKIIQKDLAENLVGAKLKIKITELSAWQDNKLHNTLPGILIDDLDIACDKYHVDPTLLKTSDEQVSETLCSDL